MCCQPPKKAADSHLIAEALQAIKLADEGTRTLTISGGEPSLDLDGLLNVVRAARNYLPDTALHVLTNARAFRYLGNAQRLASLRHNDLMLGIPLNADLPELHDYIVQVKGAFDETVLGLMNLKRCGVRVEVRLLVQGANAHRLPETARFIARNLAFADHVAVMGLEMHGRARAHRELVWIDPLDYRDALADAVTFLAQRGISVSIYNTPLCVLDQRVWLYACRSISDWKREYPAVCAPCLQKRDCGGVFATSDDIISAGVRPIT
jgi:His-Xaa-Ser system radical SAM maturase HxsC